ncbi:MAG: tetratricopeptide repeat protein [Planctomycetes bacterium]|nr:tetratricopeptide repeat protein [Planctomycetota bacterium]
MKKLRTLCVAVSVTVAVFSGIASATSQQSAPLKQTPAEGEILDLPELVARVKPSVVTILTYDADGQPAGQGSGFFIAEDRIVTNLHVIQGANRAELRLTSGAMFDITGVLADDERHDLVLLQVDLSTNGSTLTIKPLRLADTIPKEGERIAVIGSPRGLEQTVSDGIVSAVREIPGFGTIIQMTAAISPGSSGSPVLNMRGEVIAVARSIVVDAQSLNFAVAIEHVAAMQAGKLRRLNEVDRQATEGSDEALEELARGVAAYLANDYQKALVHFRRVIEIEPDDAEGHSNLGAVYIDLGRYQEALDTLKQAIRIKPHYAEAHLNLGVAYGKLGRYQEALDAVKQAIRIKPDDAEAHYNLGRAYVKLGRYQDAIAGFNQAIRVKPNFAEAHLGLAVVYLMIGDKASALDEYKVLKELDRDLANKLFNLIYK